MYMSILFALLPAGWLVGGGGKKSNAQRDGAR